MTSFDADEFLLFGLFLLGMSGSGCRLLISSKFGGGIFESMLGFLKPLGLVIWAARLGNPLKKYWKLKK